MNHLVYLSGPIAGLSMSEATNWRSEVREALEPDIRALDPMRGQHSTDLADYPSALAQKAMFERDFQDVLRADLTFVNLLGAKAVSQGTIYEIGWAYHARKPLVVAIEAKGNPHDHLFLQHQAGFLVRSIADAIRVTRSLLLG